MNQKTLRRTIHPEIRVLDAAQGLVEYIASDETLDTHQEVIRADGWRFDDFARNAPFVDSHDYSSIEKCLGRVVDFQVSERRLVETVKWAIDVPQNFLAQKGFAMTAAGYLRAVSVGFIPTRYASKWDADQAPFQAAIADLPPDTRSKVRCIYLEQQQKELSACVIGANPAALARGYKAGIFNDEELERFCGFSIPTRNQRETAGATADPAHVAPARERARTALWVETQTWIKTI